MPASDSQRLAFRDRFRSLHHEAFQSWLEELLRAIYPTGDFQAVRKTRGDGGLDGFVISSQLVYAVYAPARREEDRDSETAAKIRSDFAKAISTLSGNLRAWIFVHNHPTGKLGRLSLAAINNLVTQNPNVNVTVLNIDGLWEKLSTLPNDTLNRFLDSESDITTRELHQPSLDNFEHAVSQSAQCQVVGVELVDQILNSNDTLLLTKRTIVVTAGGVVRQQFHHWQDIDGIIRLL